MSAGEESELQDIKPENFKTTHNIHSSMQLMLFVLFFFVI